ncbi:MAG TPA: hypothetical protein VFX42_12395, partial [Gemmatimonadales bacterium]|nr:hypothetical protein [Gemmatimonadales bacterium]
MRAALCSGLACFLTQWGAVLLWVPPAHVSTIWIPGGLMLALAMLTEPRRWPAVILGAASGTTLLFLALGLVLPGAALLLSLLACVQTVAIAATLRVVLRRPLALATLGEFLTYFGTIGGGALIAASLFLAGVWASGTQPASFTIWRTFALAVVLGYLTTTPTL